MINYEEADKWLSEHQANVQHWISPHKEVRVEWFANTPPYIHQVRAETLLEAVQKAMEHENDVRRS